jgi:hypothetical protein
MRKMVAKIFKIFTVLVVIGYADSALTTTDEMVGEYCAKYSGGDSAL